MISNIIHISEPVWFLWRSWILPCTSSPAWIIFLCHIVVCSWQHAVQGIGTPKLVQNQPLLLLKWKRI